MNGFNIDDKVKLKNPNNILNFDVYVDDWKEFWYDNSNTIFTIHFTSDTSSDIYCYLKYPNGEKVMNVLNDSVTGIPIIAIFVDHELEPYINNILPDELFEL